MSQRSRTQVQSVSYRIDNFEDYIDEKIRSLVLTLVAAGQLPISSCEGHSYVEPRFLIIAFTSKSLRQSFIDKIQIYQGQIQWIEYETNSYEIVDGLRYDYGTVQDEIRGLNHLFGKRETSYCFLRILIGRKVSPEFEYSKVLSEKIIFNWRYYSAGTYNFFFRERITRKLEKLFK
jgi:hypothetical protein